MGLQPLMLTLLFRKNVIGSITIYLN